MPNVNIPNLGIVSFPDTMTPPEIERAIREQILPGLARQQAPQERQGFVPSFVRGLQEEQGRLYGAAEGLGRATGIRAIEEFGREGRERNVREAEAAMPSSAQMSFGRASGVGENVLAAEQALGGSLPSSAGPLAGALTGAAIGRRFAGLPGAGIGAVFGSAAASLPSFYGGNRARQIEESGAVQSEGLAAAAAVPQALAEGVVDRITLGLGRILGVGADTVGRELLPRIARGVGVGAVSEVPAEVFQQALERAQAGLDVLGPEAMAEYREAATAAAVVGGTMGGTFAGVLGPRPEPTPDDRRREELRGAIEEVVGARAPLPEPPAPEPEAAPAQDFSDARVDELIRVSRERLDTFNTGLREARIRLAEATTRQDVDPDEVRTIQGEIKNLNRQALQQRRNIAELTKLRAATPAAQAAAPTAAPVATPTAAPTTQPQAAPAAPVAPVAQVEVPPVAEVSPAAQPPVAEASPEIAPAAVQPVEVPAAAETATPPAPAAPRVIGFTTAQGSTYQVNDQGQTIRTERAPGSEQPETYAANNAVYVDPQEAQRLLGDLNAGLDYRFIEETDQGPREVVEGEVINPDNVKLVVFDQDQRTFEDVPVREVPFSASPAVGLSPVELRYTRDYDGNRIADRNIGDPIVSLQADEAAPQAAPTEPPVQFSSRAGHTEGQATAEETPDISRSLAVIRRFLDDLRARGEQGSFLADGLRAALNDRRFNADQIYAAFMIDRAILNSLPKGANYRFRFLEEIVIDNEAAAIASGARVGDRAEGRVIHPTRSMPGFIDISLAEETLPLLNETASHEAFHVLQSYFSAYDKGLETLLNKSFKEGMTIDQLEPSIKRRLQSFKAPGSNKSYFDTLKEDLGDKPLSLKEAQAYAFGSLNDSAIHGKKVTGLTAPFQRFFNFVKDVFSRLRSGLNGDGYQTPADLMLGAGARAERLGQEAPVEGGVQYAAKGATDQTQTEAFKKWFKDSKVVDENGRPLVVYHGTASPIDFDAFKLPGNRGKGGNAIFFATDPNTASYFARNVGRVIPAYVRMENPFDSSNEDHVSRLSAFIEKNFSSIFPGAMFGPSFAIKQLRAGDWGVLEKPAVRQWMRRNKFDGFWTSEISGGPKTMGVFDPSQIKSAIGNRGTFSETDARIDYSARRSSARASGNVAGLPGFGQRVPPNTRRNVHQAEMAVQYDFVSRSLGKTLGRFIEKPKLERFFTVMQDKMLPAGRMIDDIRAAGGNVPVAMDAYLKEDLLQGKVADMLEKRNKNLYGVLTEALSKSKISLEDFENYLYARHAPERNKYIARINPNLPDGGSGLTNEQADQFMKEFQRSGQLARMQALARLFDNIIADTNRLRVESGLTPDFSTVTKTSDGRPLPNYQNYAPLRGFADESVDADESVQEFRPKTGKALGARGREDARMLGRERKAGDIIAHAIMQNTQAVIRSETNKVGQSFLAMIRANPTQSRALAEVIDKTPMKRTVVNGVVKLVPDMTYKNAPDVLVVKEDGKEVAIRIYDENVARAMTGASALSPASKNLLVQGMASLNRYLAKINTAYNPEFLITNFVRDLQTFGVNVQQYDIDGIAKDSIRDLKSALSGVRDSVRGTNNNPAMRRAFERFKELGGTTEMYGFTDLETRIKEINEVMADVGGQPKSWRDMAKKVKPVTKFIEDYNTIVENGIRTSLFKNLVDRGINEERAAQIAKNVTVNFSKGGEQRVLMNALYLFYNASLQGTMAMVNAMYRSPRVRKIVAGIVVAGVLQDVINSMLSDSDDDEKKIYDKIPENILKNRFILMDPFQITERGYFSFPMPYGFNAFYNMGREMSKAARGESSPMKAAGNIIGTFVDSFNPIGGSDNWYNFAAPTIIDPIVDVVRNRDFSGKPIVPERGGFGVQTPESQKYWNNTFAPYVDVASFLNSLTGGTRVIPGAVDISPNMIQYVVNFATGGVGKFVERTFNTVTSTIPSALRGDLEELDVRGVPFLRSLYGNVTTREDMGIFMERMNEVLTIRKEIRDARQAGQSERVISAMDQYPGHIQIMDRFNSLNRERSQISQRINELNRNENIDETIKKEMIKSLRDRQNAIVREANRLYNQRVEGRQ